MIADIKRFNAVTTILSDEHNKLLTTRSAMRVVKAARILGLNDDEVRRLMSWMAYCDTDTGEPHNKSIKRVWP